MTTPTSSTQGQGLIRDAGHAYNAGEWVRAYELASALVRLEPENAEGHYLAGLAAIASSRASIAVTHFGKAASLDGRRADYAVQLARALCANRQFGEALAAANHALGLDPADPVMLGNLGCVYVEANAHERALSTFRRAVQLGPANLFCRFNLAMSLMFTGDVGAAETELETCIARHPGFWHAHAMLAQIRKQTPEKNHIARLEALATSAPDDPEAALYLHSALGKEHEDLGEYPGAFAHFSQAKSAARRVSDYDRRNDALLVDALIEAFPAATDAPGYMTDEPIFIVGMPRTGTTLVERIISSHPEAHSAGELEHFAIALAQLAGAAPDARLDAGLVQAGLAVDPALLGERYLASTRPMTAMKPRFIDKRPHNFLYLGFIARALPKARIICLRRNPMDTCLSNFREPFNPQSPFHRYAFDLLDIGHYYVQFERLMAHWKTALPGRIFELDYETIVADQERSSRQLLEYCGLDWNDRCLHFERNAAASATASSTQVRSPIYSTAVQRWHHYRQEMAPLRQLLVASGIEVGD
jgi:cytochrome c-type biogenesis protein CcmH/NrfG